MYDAAAIMLLMMITPRHDAMPAPFRCFSPLYVSLIVITMMPRHAYDADADGCRFDVICVHYAAGAHAAADVCRLMPLIFIFAAAAIDCYAILMPGFHFARCFSPFSLPMLRQDAAIADDDIRFQAFATPAPLPIFSRR